MTDNEIKQAQVLCEEAPPGPWESETGEGEFRQNGGVTCENADPDWHGEELIRTDKTFANVAMDPETRAFVCGARTLLPKALKEIERLRKLVAELEEETTGLQLATNFSVDSGKHLGAVRKWIKWNARNGEHVKWGSNEVLEYTFTVANLEEIAQQVADAMKDQS